ncbi:hypothetical protein JCM11491_003784 [Sporobolomyces phaffii]
MNWLGSIFGAFSSAPEDPPPPPPPPPPPRLPPASTAEATVRVGVILDGDADYFTSAYTSKGFRGGRSAALDLRNKVHHCVLSRTTARSVDMVAYSFLNLAGLSNFLGPAVDLRSFVHGFNSSPYAFSMSDVGPSSQAADEAIKSHLPFLLSTCDYVLLGGTHDGGYSQTLLRLDPTTLRDKVLLLRTTSFCAERILELGLEEIRFEGLFEGRDPPARGRPGGGGAKKPLEAPASVPEPSTSSTSPPNPQPPNPESTLSAASVPFVPAARVQPVVDRIAHASAAPILPQPPPSALPPSTSIVPIAVAPPAGPGGAGAAPRPHPTGLAAATSIDLSPLVQTLSQFLHVRNQVRPRSSAVAQALRQSYPNALEPGPGRADVSFKQYVKEAQRRGVVKSGRGLKSGTEWLQLVGTSDLYDDGGGSDDDDDDDDEARVVVAAAAATTDPATTEPDFAPLAAILLSYLDSTPSTPRALLAKVGRDLGMSPNAPFPPRQPGQFRRYYQHAVARGIVRVGPGTVMGTDWIELAVSRDDARAMVARAAGGGGGGVQSAFPQGDVAERVEREQTPTIESRFYPLVETLARLRATDPRGRGESEWTTLGQLLRRDSAPPPYGSQSGGLKRYLEDAQNAGLVDTGRIEGKQHGYWIRLSSDILRALVSPVQPGSSAPVPQPRRAQIAPTSSKKRRPRASEEADERPTVFTRDNKDDND